MFVTWETILGRQLVYFILCLSLWDIYFQVCCPSLDEAGKFEPFGLRRIGFLGLETVPTQISCRVFFPYWVFSDRIFLAPVLKVVFLP